VHIWGSSRGLARATAWYTLPNPFNQTVPAAKDAMRVALLSDIHGNDVALRAVLADIRRHGVDQIVCLGDVATLGPAPQRTIDLLAELNCPCIMGNHDAFLLEPGLVEAYTQAAPVIDAINWCREELSSESFDYLRTFKPITELPLGSGSMLLYHGSPRSNVEDILATTPPEHWTRFSRSGRLQSWLAATPICRCCDSIEVALY